MGICIFAAVGEVVFVLLTPLLAIALGYFGAYAAHSLFVVIEQTAAGFDRVCWPQEAFTDWFVKLIHILGIVLLVLLPTMFAIPWLDIDSGVSTALLAGSLCFLLFWLVLPVVLLSSLSGASRLNLVRWEIVKGLARCWLPLLVFYGLTGVLEFMALGSLFFAVLGWRELQMSLVGMNAVISVGSLVVGVPFAAILAATAVLWYGRLLGRLGWMLQIAEHPAEERESEPEEEIHAPPDSPAPPAPAEAIPLEMAAPAGVTGETFAVAEEPKQAPPVIEPPFRWQPGRMPPPAPPRSEWRDQPGTRERVADVREDKPEPFTAPRVASLLEPKILFFPWYRTSFWPWLVLVFGMLCLTLLARLPVGY